MSEKGEHICECMCVHNLGEGGRGVVVEEGREREREREAENEERGTQCHKHG